MSYKIVQLPSDEPVMFVGVYVMKWKDVLAGAIIEPTVGFVEIEEDDEEYAPGLPEPED